MMKLLSQNRVLLPSCLLACSLAAYATVARAETVAAPATVAVPPGPATVMPGRTPGIVRGLPVAVISATDSSGNIDAASRALMAASFAVSNTSNFRLVPPASVVSALATLDPRGPLNSVDYQAIGKKVRAARVLTVTVTPGTMDAASNAYNAVVELYDAASGGLVGRGESLYTAVADAAAPAAPTAAAKPGAPAPTARTMLQRAIDGAVWGAVAALTEPATMRGVVVSRPAAYQARISLGERNGLRNGASVVFFDGARTIAYGTVISLGTGEAVATVAPESASPGVGINTEVRTTNNPPAGHALRSQSEIDEKDWKRFETEFAIAIVLPLAYQAHKYGF